MLGQEVSWNFLFTSSYSQSYLLLLLLQVSTTFGIRPTLRAEGSRMKIFYFSDCLTVTTANTG